MRSASRAPFRLALLLTSLATMTSCKKRPFESTALASGSGSYSTYEYLKAICDNISGCNSSLRRNDSSESGGSYYRGGGGGGSICLVGSTPIETTDGLKEIADLKVGDKVLSYDFKADRVAVSTVTKTFIHENKPYRELSFGNHRKTLGITDNHPVFNYDTHQWLPAGEFVSGDSVFELNDGDSLVGALIDDIKIKGLPLATVYNIEVEPHHNYFAAGILVHNK